MIKTIERKESVVTGKTGLVSLHKKEIFPVFFGCVDSDISKDIRADLDWAIEPDTGIIQLTKLVPLDILYQSQHMDGTGKTWNNFYASFAEYISRRVGKSKILEVGGGTGSLGKKFLSIVPDATWTIVEPNPVVQPQNGLHVQKGFVDKNFTFKNPVDAVVFSHTLEHAYQPKEFLLALAKLLEPGKKLIFAYPRLEIWLNDKISNALNFEHNFLITEPFIDYLLPQCGFEVVNKEYFGKHSVYYEAVRKDSVKEIDIPNKYDEYRRLFLDYIKYYNKLIKDLNKKIDGFEGEIYLFGAHIFSQHLLEYGLKSDKINGILDNSKMKQGKRLYGTHLKVFSPSILAGKQKTAVVLKVGVYRDEILEQLLKINPLVTILE